MKDADLGIYTRLHVVKTHVNNKKCLICVWKEPRQISYMDEYFF